MSADTPSPSSGGLRGAQASSLHLFRSSVTLSCREGDHPGLQAPCPVTLQLCAPSAVRTAPAKPQAVTPPAIRPCSRAAPETPSARLCAATPPRLGAHPPPLTWVRLGAARGARGGRAVPPRPHLPAPHAPLSRGPAGLRDPGPCERQLSGSGLGREGAGTRSPKHASADGPGPEIYPARVQKEAGLRARKEAGPELRAPKEVMGPGKQPGPDSFWNEAGPPLRVPSG